MSDSSLLSDGPDLEQCKEFVNANNKCPPGVTPGAMPRARVESLRSHQRAVLYRIIQCYLMTPDDYTSVIDDMALNSLSYLNLFINIASEIVNMPCPGDCWLSSHRTQGSGPSSSYPQIKCTVVEWGHKLGQGTRLYRREGTAPRWVAVHRFLASMLHHEARLAPVRGKHGRESQCSHRCHRPSQRCVNPSHIVIKDDAGNKDMNGCLYGCAHYCPHIPICLFTNAETGKDKPCLSDASAVHSKTDCLHSPSCF